MLRRESLEARKATLRRSLKEEEDVLMQAVLAMSVRDSLELLVLAGAQHASKRVAQSIQKAAAAKSMQCMAEGRHLEAVRLLIQTSQRQAAEAALEAALLYHTEEQDTVRQKLIEMQADIDEI